MNSGLGAHGRNTVAFAAHSFSAQVYTERIQWARYVMGWKGTENKAGANLCRRETPAGEG